MDLQCRRATRENIVSDLKIKSYWFSGWPLTIFVIEIRNAKPLYWIRDTQKVFKSNFIDAYTARKYHLLWEIKVKKHCLLFDVITIWAFYIVIMSKIVFIMKITIFGHFEFILFVRTFTFRFWVKRGMYWFHHDINFFLCLLHYIHQRDFFDRQRQEIVSDTKCCFIRASKRSFFELPNDFPNGEWYTPAQDINFPHKQYRLYRIPYS